MRLMNFYIADLSDHFRVIAESENMRTDEYRVRFLFVNVNPRHEIIHLAKMGMSKWSILHMSERKVKCF